MVTDILNLFSLSQTMNNSNIVKLIPLDPPPYIEQSKDSSSDAALSTKNVSSNNNNTRDFNVTSASKRESLASQDKAFLKKQTSQHVEQDQRLKNMMPTEKVNTAHVPAPQQALNMPGFRNMSGHDLHNDKLPTVNQPQFVQIFPLPQSAHAQNNVENIDRNSYRLPHSNIALQQQLDAMNRNNNNHISLSQLQAQQQVQMYASTHMQAQASIPSQIPKHSTSAVPFPKMDKPLPIMPIPYNGPLPQMPPQSFASFSAIKSLNQIPNMRMNSAEQNCQLTTNSISKSTSAETWHSPDVSGRPQTPMTPAILSPATLSCDKNNDSASSKRRRDKCRYCRKYKPRDMTFEMHMRVCPAAPDINGRICKYCSDLISHNISYAEHNEGCKANVLKYKPEIECSVCGHVEHRDNVDGEGRCPRCFEIACRLNAVENEFMSDMDGDDA